MIIILVIIICEISRWKFEADERKVKMGLLDGIGKIITQTGQDTVKKAKSFAEATKINSQIAEEQRALNTFYAQIGEKYYKLYKDAPADEFAQLCDRLTAGIIRIAELQTEVQRLKNTKMCPKCGAVCPINVLFCSTCGAQLPKYEPEEIEAEYTGPETAAEPQITEPQISAPQPVQVIPAQAPPDHTE